MSLLILLVETKSNAKEPEIIKTDVSKFERIVKKLPKVEKIKIGDTIIFWENVLDESNSADDILGIRYVKAEVIDSDSEGVHKFRLKILDSAGVNPLQKNSKVFRKYKEIFFNSYLVPVEEKIEEPNDDTKELKSPHGNKYLTKDFIKQDAEDKNKDKE